MKSFDISGHARLQVHRVLLNMQPKDLGEQIKALKCANTIQLRRKDWDAFGVYRLSDEQKVKQGYLMSFKGTTIPVQSPIPKVDPRKDRTVKLELPDDHAEWFGGWLKNPGQFIVADADWLEVLIDGVSTKGEVDLTERWSQVLSDAVAKLEEEAE